MNLFVKDITSLWLEGGKSGATKLVHIGKNEKTSVSDVCHAIPEVKRHNLKKFNFHLYCTSRFLCGCHNYGNWYEKLNCGYGPVQKRTLAHWKRSALPITTNHFHLYPVTGEFSSEDVIRGAVPKNETVRKNEHVVLRNAFRTWWGSNPRHSDPLRIQIFPLAYQMSYHPLEADAKRTNSYVPTRMWVQMSNVWSSAC